MSHTDQKKPPKLTIYPPSLPSGTVGLSYKQVISSRGGRSPYRYSFTGSLPHGITLSTGGLLNGVPTVAGTSSFTAAVRDGRGATASQKYTLVINAAQPDALVVPRGQSLQGKIFERPQPMPVQSWGRRYISGIPSSSDTDVTAWINAVYGAGGTISQLRANALTTFVSSLKANNNSWGTLDRLWILEYGSDSLPQGTIDLVARANFASVNGGSWLANGWLGNGTISNYIDTGYNPANTGMQKWQLGSATIGIYLKGDSSTALTYPLGCWDLSDNACVINIGGASGIVFYSFMNVLQTGQPAQINTMAGNFSGRWIVTRIASAAASVNIYLNASLRALQLTSDAASAIPSYNIYLGANNVHGVTFQPYGSGSIAMANFGASMTAGQVSDFDAAIVALGI